ncbi:MAG TPA: ferredoxin [Acidimicrobiales bacterium]|jgi:ferredoxin|nr:ferredoxin [Acidimicrobiales bacterium]
MPLEVSVDQDLCIGTGNCVYWAPDAFVMGDDGHAHATNSDGLDDDDIIHAARQCPISAVRVWRDGESIV